MVVTDVEGQQKPPSNAMKAKHGKSKTRFEVGFKRFCGFSWPGYAPVLLWTITITGFFVLTVVQLNSIIYDYMHNNEIVQMRVRYLRNVKNIWPNMTVCIPYYSNQLARVAQLMNENWKSCQNWDKSCQNMTQSDLDLLGKCQSPDLDDKACMNSSLDPTCFLQDQNLRSTCDGLKQLWNGWVDVETLRDMSSDSYDENKMSKSFFQKALSDYAGGLGLFFKETTYNISDLPSRKQLMLDAVWKYIQCIFKIDLLALVDGIIQINENDCASIGFDFSLLENGSLLESLFRNSVGSMEDYFMFEIPSKGNLFSRENLYQEKDILLVDDKLCVPLPLDPGNRSMHDACKTQSGNNSEAGCYVFHVLNNEQWTANVVDGMNELSGSIELYDDPMALYSPQEVNYFYVFSPRGLPADQTEQQKNAVLEYTVASRVITREVRKNCSDMEYVKCLRETRFNDTIQFCMCKPFSLTHRNFSSSAANYSYCSVADYMKCTKHVANVSLEPAKRKCRNMCERTIYTWVTKAAPLDQQNKTLDNETVVQFRPNEDPFLEFSQTPKDSRSQFLCNIGGAVNLYLGASGLTACAFIIFGIDLVKRLYRLSKKQEAQRNSIVDSLQVKGHLMWMTTAMMMGGQKAKDESENIEGLKQANQKLKRTVQRMEHMLHKMERRVLQLEGGSHQARPKAKNDSQPMASPPSKSK